MLFSEEEIKKIKELSEKPKIGKANSDIKS